MDLFKKFKIDLTKIKKITAIEITTVTLALIAIGIYQSPKFLHKQDVMMAAKIKADSSIFTSKVLEEFASNKDIKASTVAKKVMEELNLTTKNPYNKKNPAYTYELECKACNSVEVNDSLSMIILTTYNKKGELISRTVIKPPSFVTYLKED